MRHCANCGKRFTGGNRSRHERTCIRRSITRALTSSVLFGSGSVPFSISSNNAPPSPSHPPPSPCLHPQVLSPPRSPDVPFNFVDPTTNSCDENGDEDYCGAAIHIRSYNPGVMHASLWPFHFEADALLYQLMFGGPWFVSEALARAIIGIMRKLNVYVSILRVFVPHTCLCSSHACLLPSINIAACQNALHRYLPWRRSKQLDRTFPCRRQS